MKASELISWLRRTRGYSIEAENKRALATKLERFLALADAVKRRKDVYVLNPDYHHALAWAEERIREILEETI